MNTMNSATERVSEASKVYLGRVEAKAPAGHGQIDRPDPANYASPPGKEFSNPEPFVLVRSAYPEGIRELSSPLSD